jgi:crotonobetainyl-CoA:carnitine CoA-transferase CaiB-like acyl-CoA transferase
LRAENVPCAPVLSRTELLTDEQVLINGIIEIHEHPLLGPVRQTGRQVQYDAGRSATVGTLSRCR